MLVPTDKLAGRKTRGGSVWNLLWLSVRELFQKDQLHCCMQFFQGHVFSIGGTLSPLRRQHTQCGDWRYTNN